MITTIMGDVIPAPLLHWFWLRLGNGRGAVRRLAGRWRRNRFRSRRHRLFQRYDSIPSNGLSNLSHGWPPLVVTSVPPITDFRQCCPCSENAAGWEPIGNSATAEEFLVG